MMENKSKLNWESFKEKLGSWDRKFYPFYLSGGFDPIYKQLKLFSSIGKVICPESKNVFRTFSECPLDELKCIFVGLSPYHSLVNGQTIADGIALSCSVTNYPQPSLDQWYNAQEFELYNGICVPCIKNPDLKFLANQGVLLLNAGLTCEANVANSHGKLWEPFMQFLFEEAIPNVNVPIVFLGQQAAKLEKYISPFTDVFRLSHPASASYRSEVWNSEGVFKKLNTVFKERNNETIQWIEE